MESSQEIKRGRGRPATQTPEERYEKWKNYMRVYMNKRYKEQIASREPKEHEVKPSSKEYKPQGRRSISNAEREEKIYKLEDEKQFKDCISIVSPAEKREKSREYFRNYYARHRDELLNKANLAYHRKIIAEKIPASQSVVNFA